MKFKNSIGLFLGFLSYFMIWGIVLAWDNFGSHPNFNEAILEIFEANYESFFTSEYKISFSENQSQYKGLAVTNPGFFENTYGESELEKTIYDWITHGGYSADEPELQAAVRHFYDPVGLNNGKKYLTNRGTYWEEFYHNPHIDAISWAMNGSEYQWSLSKGKEYLTTALQATDESTKNENFAKAFRALGEVLHNTADMGCPPHVRNDSHAAPIGWTLGDILGSPDATEEMFIGTNYISLFMDYEADGTLESYFNNATTIRSIHEKLAEYTNANFFTTQTMNGSGERNTYPINNDGHYQKPLLNELEYDKNEYTYFKQLENGEKIKMAKDKGYFWRRTYPYIDKECVKSQSTLLVPNIIWAGLNVVKLFIPKFEVKINSANKDGEIIGQVKHLSSDEYANEILYSGKFKIYNSVSNQKIGELNCVSGSANGSITNISVNSEIYAAIDFAGITISSEKIKIQDISSSLSECIVGVQVIVDKESNNEGEITSVTEPLTFGSYTLEGGITGNNYSGSVVMYEDIKQNLLITFNANQDTIQSIIFTSIHDDPNTEGFVHYGFSANDIPYNLSSEKFEIRGALTCSKIQNIYYNVDNGGTYTSRIQNHRCNEISYITINLSE